MAGYIVLQGGAEFGGRMADSDRRALDLAGGLDAPVRILPTAAAPDDNHRRAGGNGERWFRQLGATDVAVVPVIDAATADDPQLLAALRQARLIYLLGGFPHHLGRMLRGSRAWDAVLAAYAEGAVVAGSSAGAMVLCQWYLAPRQGGLHPGLNLVPGTILMPHFDPHAPRWLSALREQAPDATLLGVAERTGIIDDGPDGRWQVYGGGPVAVYRGQQAQVYGPGDDFCI